MKTIHLIVKTWQSRYSGTKSDPVLIMGRDNQDIVHHTFELSEPLEAGETHHLSFGFPHLERTNYYHHIRLGIRGADAWWPEQILAWAESDDPNDDPFMPIAFRSYSAETLSTDAGEGRISIPLNRAYLGGYYTYMSRILVVIKTGDGGYDGTKSKVHLDLTTLNGIHLQNTIDGESSLNKGQLYVTALGLGNRFRQHELRNIRLSIEGEDQWNPESVMIFGLDDQGDNEYMIPLVYIKDWSEAGLPKMDADDSKAGVGEVDLFRSYL